jgi:hypothetical protein
MMEDDYGNSYTLCDDAMSVHGEADPLKPFDVRP